MGVIDIYNKIGDTNELTEPTLVDAIKNSGGGVKEWTKAKTYTIDLSTIEFSELYLVDTYSNDSIVLYIPSIILNKNLSITITNGTRNNLIQYTHATHKLFAQYSSHDYDLYYR